MSELTDKLTSGNVKDLDGGRFYLVDKAKSVTLHADILADKYVLPAGWLLVLKDGATTIAKLGDGVAKWTGAISMGGGASAAVTWGDVSGKPATFPPVVGTTATTAKAGNYAPTTLEVGNALKAKTQIAALVSPATDYADLTAATAAIKSIIDALKA